MSEEKTKITVKATPEQIAEAKRLKEAGLPVTEFIINNFGKEIVEELSKHDKWPI